MDYNFMIMQLESLSESEKWYVSLLSNASALLFESLPDLNWAGFYLLREKCLSLGPFQGKIACIHIPIGKGVCGTAFEKNETLCVSDVHTFPGHIACDSASNSELVIPLRKDGIPFAVLDLDSPKLNRFSKDDIAGLERFAQILQSRILLGD